MSGKQDKSTKLKPLGFDWDTNKQDKNWQKHQVSYRECEEVFLNKALIIFPDKKHSLMEKRLVAYGKTDNNRGLTIVFTLRKRGIRVISARDQNKKERRIYEQK